MGTMTITLNRSMFAGYARLATSNGMTQTALARTLALIVKKGVLMKASRHDAPIAVIALLFLVAAGALIAVLMEAHSGAGAPGQQACACPDPTMIVRDQHGPIYGYSTQGPGFVGAPAMCWVRPDGLATFDSSGVNPWRARRR